MSFAVCCMKGHRAMKSMRMWPWQAHFKCAAIDFAKAFHGDSVYMLFLKQQSALIRPPTTMVKLQSGKQFETRSLNPSRNRHREINNSLRANACDLEKKQPAQPRGSRLFDSMTLLPTQKLHMMSFACLLSLKLEGNRTRS
jgi:hypothetical protein